jgi:hypothetical protein
MPAGRGQCYYDAHGHAAAIDFGRCIPLAYQVLEIVQSFLSVFKRLPSRQDPSSQNAYFDQSWRAERLVKFKPTDQAEASYSRAKNFGTYLARG